MRSNHTVSLRKKVASEAALLLYISQEKEFKQAKLKAAEALGIRILPSNLEVALELDRIADEYEGQLRAERLTQMRREALEIMACLRDFSPRLIGSVWRGTAHKNSDIDIVVFSSNPRLVVDHLHEGRFKIAETEHLSKTSDGEVEESFHIYLTLSSGDQAEIVVRDLEKIDREQMCEIYGDTIKGLNFSQLDDVVKEEPTRRFLRNRIKVQS